MKRAEGSSFVVGDSSGFISHSDVDDINNLSSRFLASLSFRENELKTSEGQRLIDAPSIQVAQLKIEELHRIREIYLRTANLGTPRTLDLNHQQEILLRIADMFCFSRLAFYGQIEAPLLATVYRESLSSSVKGRTYGEERERFLMRLRQISDECSELSRQVATIDRRILNEMATGKIVEEDILEEEDEGLAEEGEIHRPPGLLTTMLIQQNYDGDSEKSCYTENESSKRNMSASYRHPQSYVRRGKNGGSSVGSVSAVRFGKTLFGYKPLKRGRHNRYREERFPFEKRVFQAASQSQLGGNNVKSQKEYESDMPEKDEGLLKNLEPVSVILSHTDQEEPSSAALLSSSNQNFNGARGERARNSGNNDSSFSNSNSLLNIPLKPVSQPHKKPFHFGMRKVNIPCRNHDDYETDREKESYTNNSIQQQMHSED